MMIIGNGLIVIRYTTYNRTRAPFRVQHAAMFRCIVLHSVLSRDEIRMRCCRRDEADETTCVAGTLAQGLPAILLIVALSVLSMEVLRCSAVEKRAANCHSGKLPP